MAARPDQMRIMLGFVVRQCAVALGHRPTPAELADWANEQRDERGRYRIFGRAITADEGQGRCLLDIARLRPALRTE